MTRQIATFILGDAQFGLDILLVKEVYRSVAMTPIPDAPDQIRGLMNLRGRVVTVMDLNTCLNRPSKGKNEEQYLLILKTDEEVKSYKKKGQLSSITLGEDIAGFPIDQMDDVIEVEPDEILPPPPNLMEVSSDLVEGIVKKGDRLVILLDITTVLESVMKVMEELSQEII